MDNAEIKQILKMRFFEPDGKMINWLKSYIGDRIPIDVGCGTGDFLLELEKGGIGIDPMFTGDQHYLLENRIHILEQRIEECKGFLDGIGSRGIMIFARPCHSPFVQNGIDIAPAGMEVLYISKKINIIQYCDLGRYDLKKKLLKHEGAGQENEVVYSIKK